MESGGDLTITQTKGRKRRETISTPGRPRLPSGYGSIERGSSRFPTEAERIGNKRRLWSVSTEGLSTSRVIPSPNHRRGFTRGDRQWSLSTDDLVWAPVWSSEIDSLGVQRFRSQDPDPKAARDDDHAQYGVRKMEAIAKRWSRKTRVSMYLTVYLLSFIISLEAQATPVVEPFFLSLFDAHSLLPTIAIVTHIAFAAGKMPMAKILDVFGRCEGIALAACLYGIGYAMTACSRGIVVFSISRVLAALGGQGLQLAQQVFIADTSSLRNRALFTSTISLPWLLTIWIGPPLGQAFKDAGPIGYRFAYAVFGIFVPLLCLPLVMALWLHYRRFCSKPETAKVTRSPSELSAPEEAEEPWERQGLYTLAVKGFHQFDIVGLALFCAGTATLLLPLSLAATRAHSWSDERLYAVCAFGVLCMAAFFHWEGRASSPLLPYRLLKNRTILAGSCLGLFHFISQFTYEIYFTSVLQVSRGLTARDAQYISQSYIFAACVSAIVAGLLSRWSKRYRAWGIIGVLLHGIGVTTLAMVCNLESPTFALVIAQVVNGIGGGMTTIAGQIGVQSVVDHQDVAVATAIFLTVTTIGGAVGGAVSGAIWSTVLPRRLENYLPREDWPEIPRILGSLSEALSFPRGSTTRVAIDKAYMDVQFILNLAALVSIVPAFWSICGMENVHLDAQPDLDISVALEDTFETSEDVEDSVPLLDAERDRLIPPRRFSSAA